MTTDEPLWITRIFERESRNGGSIIEVEFVGIKSQQIYKTYLFPNNHNFRHWSLALSIGLDNSVIINSGLDLKDPKKGLVNADNKPEIVSVTTPEEAVEIIGEYWNRSKGGDIFE